MCRLELSLFLFSNSRYFFTLSSGLDSDFQMLPGPRTMSGSPTKRSPVYSRVRVLPFLDRYSCYVFRPGSVLTGQKLYPRFIKRWLNQPSFDRLTKSGVQFFVVGFSLDLGVECSIGTHSKLWWLHYTLRVYLSNCTFDLIFTLG